MLARTALGASKGPRSRTHLSAYNTFSRSYGTKRKPARPRPKPSSHQIASSQGPIKGNPIGPIPNRTWSPKLASSPSIPRSLNQASSPLRGHSQSTPQGSSWTQTARFSTARPNLRSAPDFNKPSNRDESKPTSKTSEESADPSSTDYSVQQPEFESVASPNRGKDPEIDSVASSHTSHHAEADTKPGDEGPISMGPLPDLRQGIPSTFDQEVAEQQSGSGDGERAALDLTDNAQVAGGGRGEAELPPEAYMTSIEKRRNQMMRWFYMSLAAFALAGIVYFGQEWESEEEARRHSDIPNGWHPMAVYGRLKARISHKLGHYTEPAFPTLLPTVDPTMRAPYTLVVSLEDLLVSSKWSRQGGWEVAKRPGVDYFLRYLSQYYELVIFTTVQSMNADLVMKKLDPFQLTLPLFREATRYMNGEHVKDLSYLNRDLSKTLIIDTVPAHTQLQPDNAVILPKWSGQPRDPHAGDLVAMIPFLEYIASMNIDDVRKVIKSYEGTHIPTEFQRREARAREKFNNEMEAKKSKRRSGGSLGNVLGMGSGPKAVYPEGVMQPVVPANPSEGFAQGKMLSDQIRENAQKNYEILDRDLRENGAKLLEEKERQEKEFMEEHMKSMQSSVLSAPKRWLGLDGDGSGKAQNPDSSR